MAQKTFVDGDVLTASDLNTYCGGEGGAWTAYTPTLAQGVSTNIAKTVTYARYARYGRTIHFQVNLAVTAAGTASSTITVSLPVTAATSGATCNGTGIVVDTSAGESHRGIMVLSTTTAVSLDPAASTASGQLGAVVMTAALASGDFVQLSGTYEAAS